MRKTLLMTAALLLVASPALAQQAQRQAASANSIAGNLNAIDQAQSLNSSNTNDVTAVAFGQGGSATTDVRSGNENVNENENKNINNQGTDVDVKPSQGITLEGSTHLPPLPGLMPVPQNFSQPYREKFINDRHFQVTSLTRNQAEDCADGSIDWFGGKHESSEKIELFYNAEQAPVPMDMSHYVGSAMATGRDTPWIAVLCEAALEAMDNGVTHALVQSIVRPENKTSGFGFGSSAGMSGLPSAGTHPYAVAAVAGFGTGVSRIRVVGEAMIELTGFRKVTPKPKATKTKKSAASYGPAEFAEVTSD
ncbi:MAG: hypothetical protein ACE5HV_17645 [Acidobacteriota bacterium]